MLNLVLSADNATPLVDQIVSAIRTRIAAIIEGEGK